MRNNNQQSFIKIPNFDPIPIGQGTVPVSGATVSTQELNRELKKAAKNQVVPPPTENSGISPE